MEALESSGDLVRGELRPGGTQRGSGGTPEVLRRLRLSLLAVLRKEIGARRPARVARSPPSWQGR